MKSNLFCILCIFLGLCANAQNIHYVNPGALGTNDGTSWENAFTNLHDALLTAQKGESVWVAAGIYRPTMGTDRNVGFALRSGVKLLGGFTGNEISLSQRNWKDNPSIIDGDIGVPNDSTDNTYNLLFLKYPDGETEINGFIFRDATANNVNSPNFDPTNCGAALFIDGKDSIAYPLVTNCRFEHNTAAYHGGAVYADAGPSGSIAPRFQNCQFLSNRANAGSGGAVYRRGSSWVEWPGDFADCVFEDNFALKNGGAIFYADASRKDTLDVTDCLFLQNTAKDFGGAFYTGGRPTGTFLCFKNVHFEENSGRIGGGLHYYSDQAPIELLFFDSCVFLRNRAVRPFPSAVSYAPNILIYSGNSDSLNGKIQIRNTVFKDQIIGNYDEIALFYTPVIVDNCLFNNAAGFFVGSNGKIFFTNNRVQGNSDYIGFSPNLNNISLFIYNNLFVNNTNFIGYQFSAPAVVSGNTFANNVFSGTPAPPINPQKPSLIFNNIFYNNHNTHPDAIGKDIPLRNDSAYFYNNLVYDLQGCSGLYTQYICGTDNLFGVDPLFSDTANLDFSLLPCSPAINTGLNDYYEQQGILTDVEGNPRIQDLFSDLGAIESPALSSATPPGITQACAGTPSGGVSFNLANGCAPYSFQWIGNNLTGVDTTGLLPGNYIFTITDQQGKQLEQPVQIGEAPEILIAEHVEHASCITCADGYIALSEVSGQGPFTYLWSNGNMVDSIGGLIPGTYLLTITDGFGCTTEFFFTVSFESGTNNSNKRQEIPFVIQPNPAGQSASIQFGLPQDNVRVRITDLNGLPIWSGVMPNGSNSLLVPVSQFLPGIYTVFVEHNNGISAGKLLVH